MTVITSAQVKTLLGITASTYDAAIALKIPIIDSLVKRLTRNRYSYQVNGSIVTNSKTLTVSTIYSYAGILLDPYVDGITINDILVCGQQIEGTGIASGSYITDMSSFGCLATPTITLSANATATGSVVALTGIPIDLQQVIAKGIWFMIDNDSTVLKDDTWISRRMGNMSVTRGNKDTAIDNTSGMPMWFIKAFPSFQGGY